MPPITSSVGVNCPNKRNDVLIVQHLLNSKVAMFTSSKLTEDGICGTRTVGAIKEFQRKVVGMAAPDGRVEPNGQTIQKLTLGAVQPAPVASPVGAISITGVELPEPAKKVLREILQTAQLTSAVVTSGTRTAADQARVMYDNIKTYGVAHQKNLYGVNGDKVIDVYVANAGKTKDAVVELMKNKIVALGPSKVSKHCSDTHYTFDIKPSSIANHQKFIQAVKSHPSVSKFLQPPADPAFHIEIPKNNA